MNKQQRTTAPGYTNRKMNNATYKLRRMVMDFIYEAKKIVDLPRIDVRIVDADDKCVWGAARLEMNVVFINARTLNMSKRLQRHVVFHEICHAVAGTPHIESCPLMKACVDEDTAATLAQQNKALKKYIG